MAKNSDYRMAIKIAGEIEKSLYMTTDMTRKELNKIAREAAYTTTHTRNSFREGLNQTEPYFEKLEKVGVKTFKAIAAGATATSATLLGIGAASAKAGIEFESAFAGVKKTTTATAEEYEQMRQEILAMTREIPAAGTEIAEVAEAAGQLGIEKENLLEFSRTMIDLGESTDLTATEGASKLAKFANITKMSADHYRNLGSTVVALGNNFATTESEIVEMATRLASTAELAGFSEAQILAMATSMSSVGIEAQAGGSAMSRAVKGVQIAVETGSESLKDYAQVADMSVDEFKDKFEEDALSAVAAFIGGLNDIERNGKSATVILDEMGLTEVNLSNTLLSLASADELMYNAVEKANEAWEENTALTVEAAARYETTESKISVMKQGFTEMGIAISDQLNEPLRDGIDMVTEMIHAATDDMNTSNVISEIAQDIINGVPTAVRVTGQLVETVGDFAEPFLAVGGWLADNPGLLEGTITGVGTALITYKVAKGVSSLATAFASLGPASLPVLGLTAAAAAIGGVTMAVKKSAAEAKKANLEEHFGDITLSMKELEKTAAYIVSNDSMGELQESINGLRELEGINESINDTVDELNRANWKVSIGMELEEKEQELYKQNIAKYVTDVQSYVEQEQYSIHLAVGVLTGDELESSNIVTQLNDFYSGKKEELAGIGKDLNECVTAAFKDDFLGVDEAKEIAELQKQMADIKAGLAIGNFESNLELLEMEYSAGELDADTFMNLQEEIRKQIEIAKQSYDEAYIAYSSAQKAMLQNGEITQEQYENNMETAENGYKEQVGSLETKGLSFQSKVILGKYEDEVGSYVDAIPEALQTTREKFGMPENFHTTEENLKALEKFPDPKLEYKTFERVSGIDDIDKDTRAAMAELWEGMKGVVQQLEELKQEYIDDGKEVPKYITDGINEGLAIGLMAGDKTVLMNAMIHQDTDSVDESIEGMYAYTEEGLQEKFKEDIDIKAGVNIAFDGTYSLNNMPAQFNIGAVKGYKGYRAYGDGGIVTKPELAWIAEAGYPESVIPLDGSEHAMSLWKQTGELLGVKKRSGISDIYNGLLGNDSGSISNTVNNAEDSRQIVFSPVININGGNADRETIDDALSTAFEEFESMMERYIRNRERLSFR